jgi:hypothetical protein
MDSIETSFLRETFIQIANHEFAVGAGYAPLKKQNCQSWWSDHRAFSSKPSMPFVMRFINSYESRNARVPKAVIS